MSEVSFDRSTLKGMNVADLLDINVEQVEELQQFQVFNSFLASFRVDTVSLEQGNEDSDSYFALKYSVIDIIEKETANPHDLAEVEIGASFTERFYAGYGIQKLSTIIRHLMGPVPLRQFLEAGEGLEFTGLVKARTRKDKDTKEVKFYNELDVHNIQGEHTPE